ncbi:MAG: hypothetical protein C0596_08785 [Marinilabiliales bacterium]|nr:MAG: hypothetical protein C0596_08785 [Marinilabiliales bacterium]
MKAKHVLYFVLGVIGILGIIMFIFPKDGIRLNDEWVLYFPTFEEMFLEDDSPVVNTDSIVKNQVNIDSLVPLDDTTKEIDLEEIKKLVTTMEYPEDKPEALDDFFAKLTNLDEEQKVRIMHYGDSQIEGDRITAFVRNKVQGRYGGFGMGLCSTVAVYSQFSIKQEDSGNWYRYTGFGAIDQSMGHEKYGPMIAFNRFAPLTDSSWTQPESAYSGWLSFTKSDIGYGNTRKFKEIYVYYGNAKAKSKITISSDDVVLVTDSLQAGDSLFVFKYTSNDYIENVKFEFEGYDSPDFYAISFEDQTGVYIDNIALRGSSGTVFTTTDGKLLSESFAYLGTDLFILQFGGNSVPYIEDKKAAEQFGNYFYYQLAYLKSAVPEVNIIVIGPSDMSVKVKDEFETYPNLENIIEEIKKATHKAGGVYWDMYKAMGGYNSMNAWVNADPPLAGTDYTHFTPYGTSIISNMFYNAFILEVTSYTERIKNEKVEEVE